MNKYQIIAYILTALTLFFLLNLKFELQRFVRFSPAEAIESALQHNKDTSKKDPLSAKAVSSKIFLIASIIIGIIAIIPLLISLNLSNTWFTAYNLANESLNWTPIKAKITSKGRSGSTRNVNQYPSVTYYSNNVQYEFTYNDKTYHGQTLSFDNGWATTNSNSESNLLKSAPQVGQEATIYFNKKTDQSVMYPGQKYTNYSAILITIPVFLVGVIFAYFSFACALIALYGK